MFYPLVYTTEYLSLKNNCEKKLRNRDSTAVGIRTQGLRFEKNG